jgi:hypothetical protein
MSANERQVGGAHYSGGYQHWDFAVDADLGPFEYQITKYGTRHRKKAGKQDLEKSAALRRQADRAALTMATCRTMRR